MFNLQNYNFLSSSIRSIELVCDYCEQSKGSVFSAEHVAYLEARFSELQQLWEKQELTEKDWTRCLLYHSLGAGHPLVQLYDLCLHPAQIEAQTDHFSRLWQLLPTYQLDTNLQKFYEHIRKQWPLIASFIPKDACLEAENEEIQASGFMLGMTSPFFYSTFFGPFVEGKNKRITFQDKPVELVKLYVAYAQSGNLPLLDLYEESSLPQLLKWVQLWSDYIQDPGFLHAVSRWLCPKVTKAFAEEWLCISTVEERQSSLSLSRLCIGHINKVFIGLHGTVDEKGRLYFTVKNADAEGKLFLERISEKIHILTLQELTAFIDDMGVRRIQWPKFQGSLDLSKTHLAPIEWNLLPLLLPHTTGLVLDIQQPLSLEKWNVVTKWQQIISLTLSSNVKADWDVGLQLGLLQTYMPVQIAGLRQLRLLGFACKQQHILSFLKSMKQLERLHVTHCDDLSHSFFKVVSVASPNLRLLDLSYSTVRNPGPKGVRRWAAFCRQSRLEKLVIQGVKGEGALLLAEALQNLPFIQNVDARDIVCGVDTLKTKVSLLPMNSLLLSINVLFIKGVVQATTAYRDIKKLNVDCLSGYGGDPVEELGKAFPKLESLNVDGGWHSWQSPAALYLLPHLRRLRFNSLSSEVLLMLLPGLAKYCPNLEEFSCEQTPLTHDANELKIDALAQACSSLQKLRIPMRVRTEQLEPLIRHCPYLTELEVQEEVGPVLELLLPTWRLQAHPEFVLKSTKQTRPAAISGHVRKRDRFEKGLKTAKRARLQENNEAGLA